MIEIKALGGALEGADRTTQETMRWIADRRSPDQIINTLKDEADFRGRETISNDGYAQGIVDTARDTIVGNQYRLNSQPNWPLLSRLYSNRFDEMWAEEFQELLEEKFNLASDSSQCWFDASRRQTFSGLIRLAIAGFTYTGEVFATAEWLREDSRPFSTAVQILSPSRVSNPDGRMDDANLRRGVLRDLRGRPLGYYIRVGYPSEFYYGADNYKWAYVTASKPWGRRMVIHIADQIQPDQTRGISQMVAVLKDMRMTKKFEEIVLQNAVINASYAASIESEFPREMVASILGATATDQPQTAYMNLVGAWLNGLQEYVANGNAIAIDGAKIAHLFPGTKLNVESLGTPGGVGTEFEVSLLRHIAAGLGLSYEEFARDFSRTNYSSARAAMLTTWKHMQAKKRFVSDRVADEIYGLWFEEEMNAGNLPLPRGWGAEVFYRPYVKDCMTACDWVGMGRGQIDELKETQAALLRINGGLSTYEIEISKFGGDWKKIFRQRAREASLIEELGLSFVAATQKPGLTDTSGEDAAPVDQAA